MNDIFSSNGRLNRRPYFFRQLALIIPALLLFYLPMAWGIQVNYILQLLFLLIAAACMILGIYQTIKRLHDIDKSGWYALLLLVPYINLVFGLYLMFKKGTKSSNKYGDDPLQINGAVNGAGLN